MGRCAAGLVIGRQRDERTLDAGHCGDDLFGRHPKGFKLARAAGGNGDREIDLGIGNEDVRDHAEGDDVAFEVRATDGSENSKHLFLRDVRHLKLPHLAVASAW